MIAYAQNPAPSRAAAFFSALALMLSLPLAAGAQESISFDEDELFGSEDDVVEAVAETAATSAVDSLLVSEAVRVGGTFTGKATGAWTWNDPWEGSFDIAAPDDYSLAPALSSLVFFDARPDAERRFYGSMKATWPFAESTSVLTGAEYVPGRATVGPIPAVDPSVSTTSTTLSLPNVEVFELFADFSYGDALYMRFGKQTVNWGVGYFFSPANIMNLADINPFDPDAQLEGPVALRAQYTVPGTQHSLWAYSVFDAADMDPLDTALAAKAEFLVGGWELGAGGYYKRDEPVRGMLTASGSAGQVSLFGEATLSLGTERQWVTAVSSTTPGFYTTSDTDDYDDTLFFKGTAGFMYNKTEANLTVIGQYLFDGEGYADADREARIQEALDNEDAIKAILALADPDTDVDAAFTRLLQGLIYNSGRHYAALSVSKGELLLDDLTASLFVLGNLSDFSAQVRPGLSYSFFDGLSLAGYATFTVGFDDGEYVVLSDGRAMSLSLVLTLGSGSF